MATLYVWLPLSCWLLLFLGFLPAAEPTWDCASKTEDLYMSYRREYYCYNTNSGMPSTPSIEGQDTTLMDSYSSRSSSDKIQKCLKAAIGRGYKYFALFNNGECRASWENNYNDYGYERTTNQYCYNYCFIFCYSRCYYYLTQCGDGYGDSLRMNVYTIYYSYDVMLWIRLRRDAFTQYHEMFNKSSPVRIDVDNTIMSLVKVEVDTKKICGIINGTLQWFSPESPTTVIGHYLFPTSFSNIGYITSQIIGLNLNAFEAEVIEVQQYDVVCLVTWPLNGSEAGGRCSSNPYARATMYISKDYTSPYVYMKSNNYYITGYSYFYCLYSSSYKWEVAHLGSDNIAIGRNTTVSTGTSWYLNARSLEYGLYFVHFTIRNPENSRQIGYDYGFLKIVEGPLSVYISQGSSAVYIEKRNMTLDGSDTYDPDFFASSGNYENMTFTWVCYKSTDSSPDLNNVDALNVVYPDGSNPTDPDNREIYEPLTGGCFGTGPGKMPFQDTAITFNNSLMLLGNTYYMALVVHKGHRNGLYTQTITLALAPPKFNISCFSNCLPNAIINQRMGLSASCLGPDCSRTLYYQWFLYESDEMDAQEYNETENFYNYLLTSHTSTTMLLQENFFQEKMSYQIKFQVRTQYDATEFAYYDFRTNTPPEGGTCMMDKSKGEAVLEEFLLTCSGWVDADLPLRYQVNLPKPDNHYVILAVSNDSSITLRLPVGNKDDHYNLRLEVFVQDSLLATSKVNLSVIAYQPATSDLDSKLTELVGDHSTLENYVKDENQQRAVQLSISVLSAVDNLQDTNHTALRGSIIQRITHLKINDTGTVNQIASVLVEATKEELEITAESGLQSLGSCENMSAILSMERNNTVSTEAIENAGKQIIMVTGNVLGGAVYSHTTNASALEAIAKKALHMSETLARIFHDRLLPGEKPTLFESKHLSLQLARQLVGGNDPMRQNMDINGGSFVLPDLPFMSDSSHSYIDRSIQFSDLDPFIWAAQNNTYKSSTPVISLSFKDDNGNSIPVKNTESPMEIIIPTRMPENNTNKAPVNFVNPGNDSMAYHSFEITHNDTAFAVRIEPANEAILAVYLRYAKRPNATHFDFEFLIPDFSSCLPPGEENCTIVSDFMQCVGREDAPYKHVNFTKPFLPKSCGPPQNDSVPLPAPPEEGEEAQTFECPDACKYENISYSDCSCDELPDVTFLFNSTMDENNGICKAFIDFSLCENDTLVCKNSVNLLSCYVLQLERFAQCRTILESPPRLFYGMYGKCLKDPFRVFFDSTVGKAGKWYVGIDYYVPPNDTSTEEKGVPKEPKWLKKYEEKNYRWWRKLKKKTNEAEAREYLEKLIVDYANRLRWKNKYSSVYNNGCMFSEKRDITCVERVECHLKRWIEWYEWYSANGNDDDRYDDDRKRRSLDEIPTDSDEGAERLCVIVKEKPPPPRIGETLQLIEEPELDLNVSALYSFDVSLYTCLFWDETKDEWSTAGCTAGPNSTDEQLQCLCNHLTSFGGDLFVAPNTMDFDDVMLGFSNLGETGNVGVIIAVFVFVLLYIVGVIFARKADRRDKQQLSISIPVQTKKSGDHTYEIAVYTGMFGDSGTTANVSMYINGENGESEILPLQDITGAKRPFTRGSVSTFVARLPSSLGRLNYVNVWHDNSGPSPSWNLRQIVVRHVPSDRKTFFICNRWLAVEKDDGQIERPIFVADYKQMTGFQNLFYNRASKDIGDGHLWFSVITRPPNSSFTRVQRLTCCISLLFSSMVTNAMFYELGEAEENLRVKFGPIDFTWRQLMIGIQSSVLVVPVNLLIITIFRFTGPYKSSAGEPSTEPNGQDRKAATEAKTNRTKAPNEQKSKGKKETNHKKSKEKKESNDEKSKGKNKAESKSKGKMENESKLKGGKTPAEAARKTKKSKKCKLPYWFNSIGYTLAFLTSLTGATFTMFYSMVWGKEKSDKWIISVIVSLVQDIFFLQPLKVVLVASILAILLRKPPEEEEQEVESDENEEITKEELKDATSVEDKKKNPQTKISLFITSPDPIVVALAREKRLNEVKMCNIFSKFALQFFFVFLLSIASYGSRSGERFYLSKNIQDIFNTKLGKVKDVYTFWWWAENYMIPSLYASEWYNGKKFEEKDFFSNKKMFIVGLPRLRQSRVKPEPCDAWHSYPEIKRWFPRCYHDFSIDNKDEGSSGATLELVDVSPAYVLGFDDSSSSSSNSESSSGNSDSSSNSSSTQSGPSIELLCEHTLEYHDALSLGTLPIVTESNTYIGGGLLAELGYDIKTAQNVLTNLQDDIWINRLTRMVLLEFVTFEPATNLFAYCRYTFESLPTGGILPSYRIDPISFVGSNSSFSSVFIVCYVLIVLILIYSIYREIREMRQLRCKYFKDMWNFIEWAFISFTIATIVIFFFKSEYTRRLVEKVQQNPYARMSFDYVALWTDIESVFLALVIFLATMKFLRILMFNKHISIVAKSISIAKGPLISFSVCFVVVLLGFAVFGNMAFGSSAYMFSTYPRSIVNSFEMILGKGTNYDELESINRFLGPFFFFTYFLMMTMLMMNFFMAILNDSFTDAREILDAESTEDSEMADFIEQYAKERLKEIAHELRGAIGGREQSYVASVNKETRERDYFLY